MMKSLIAGVTQLVECNLAKVDVAGSNPVSRSNSSPEKNWYAGMRSLAQAVPGGTLSRR
jgi:hypothetical protein